MITDIDILVKLGYSREISRRALAETNGNCSAALEYIRTDGQRVNNEWKLFKPESDWKNKIAAVDLPRDSQMRALWKSPVTVHINSFSLSDGGVVHYKCRVITHVKDWLCIKSLEDFQHFKSSLALGTTFWFKSPFPFPWTKAFSSAINSITGVGDMSEAEKTRQMLDDWIRELTLSELCMSDDILLTQTLAFFGSNNKTRDGPDKQYSSSTSFSTSLSPFKANRVGSISNLGKAPARLYDANIGSISSSVEVLKMIRTVRKDDFPVKVASLDCMLSHGPFKIRVSDFPELALVALPSKNRVEDSDLQMEKDLVRDRLVVNGKRHQGSSSSSSSTSFLKTVVGSCVDSISEVLALQCLHLTHTAPVVSLVDMEDFSRNVLRSMSRTESAYLSLLSLNSILDLTFSSSSSSPTFPPKGGMDDTMSMPFLIVPEAILADPILLDFRILERQASADYCIECEAQTSTVYRVCDGDSMDTLLQVRVVYSRRSFAMLNSSTATDSPEDRTSTLVEKSGPSHIVFIRETKTTSRDWK